MKLDRVEMRELAWLAKQRALVWCGVYNLGGDELTSKLEALGLIEGVKQDIRIGNARFDGGYRITPAGRAALEGDKP